MVFISYSHEPPENADFVRELATKLRAANFDVWLDEERIAGAEDIEESIWAAITTADAALFVVNSRWLQRDRAYIRQEVSLFAQKTMARRVVVLRDPADDKELGPYFSTLKRLEWRREDPQPDARFWEVYCGITGTPPGPRNDWEERGRRLTSSQPAPKPAPQPPARVAPAPEPPKVRRAEKPQKVALLYKRSAQPDNQVLAMLEAALRAAGHEVFVDRHLKIGMEWAAEIERQVRQADAVIPLLSAASVQSEMLGMEVQIASDAQQQQIGKPRILPVRIDFEGPLTEPFENILRDLQYGLWHSPADDSDLLNQLLDSLDSKEKKPKILPPPPEPDVLPLDSPHYIVREPDREFLAALERQDSIVLVKGARQMGKTSLLARGLQQAREAGIRVAALDFQKLNQVNLADIESLYKALGGMIADRLDLDVYPEEGWKPQHAPSVNFERYIRRQVLGRMEGHLILAMDEVDRLFSVPYASEVFGLFRTWHNERALDPEGPWKRLTLAIVYATEAHLFITDQNQSPFNVGTRLELHDFTIEQVEKLNHLYDDPIGTPEDMKRFYTLFNGQPYLTRRGILDLKRGETMDELVVVADTDDGPYGDHLRRILVLLARDPRIRSVVEGLLRGEPIPDANSFYRLRSGGLVVGGSAHDARFRCGIYQSYLERHLG